MYSNWYILCVLCRLVANRVGVDKVGGQRHVPAALPPGKTRYPLYRRLPWPQGRSGWVRKISLPQGFDPQTVQSVASCYIDWAMVGRAQRWILERSNGGAILAGDNLITASETWSPANLPTTNHTRTEPGSSPVSLGKKLGTKHLSHDEACNSSKLHAQPNLRNFE
jgi:hypothetical protein